MQALILSFAVIFVAELGDKSQLMALTFAARYPAIPILIGITIATAVVHAMSVLLGAVVAVSLPTDAINIAAGVAFLGFAVWTMRGDSLDDEEEAKAARAERGNRSAIIAASGAFFLAELGDKTMLATITLATTHGLFGTWLGSTLGMVAADALAILVGRLLGTRLPERTIQIGATVLFVLFGVALILEGLGATPF
ncbi:MAG TPA: TMEM165/GDT1 family protein [Acidimicrobiia bacterium]|nr:TMEM165/GDT1 family protein [Acidimicrobiia bacterium]